MWPYCTTKKGWPEHPPSAPARRAGSTAISCSAHIDPTDVWYTCTLPLKKMKCETRRCYGRIAQKRECWRRSGFSALPVPILWSHLLAYVRCWSWWPCFAESTMLLSHAEPVLFRKSCGCPYPPVRGRPATAVRENGEFRADSR